MSSSSEEDLSKFKEATDVKLFNNSLFSEGKAECSATAPLKPSQRYLNAPDENRSDLKVTPGFQKHVASHLMKILDSSLDQDITSTDSNGNCMAPTAIEPLKRSEPEGGIKLFGASAAFLASCNITPPPPTKRRKRGRKFACISSGSEDDSSCNEADTSKLSCRDSAVKSESLGLRDETDLSERFAACAVSSDWILNGDAVKGWAPHFKNKEPLQGEATPDLLKVAVLRKQEKLKKRRKKEKLLKDEPVQQKKRGKRGGSKKSKKKAVKENDDSEHGPSASECKREENESNDKRLARRYRKFKLLYEKLSAKYTKKIGMEGKLVEVVPTEEKKKKKKRDHKIRALLIGHSGLEKDELHLTLKELEKKEKKLRRLRRKLELKFSFADVAPAEDEGFDSDPTKGVEGKWLVKQTKKDKNNIELLSKNLANLVMTNVKQD